MFCQVKGCRYSFSHTTKGHLCGKCNQFGHGMQECGKPAKIAFLERIINIDLPLHLQCTISGCESKETHSNSSHYCKECKQRTDSCIHCTIVNNFITKKCPICKLDSEVDTNLQIFTGSDCIICYEEKKMILFKGCKHAIICKDCFIKL